MSPESFSLHSIIQIGILSLVSILSSIMFSLNDNFIASLFALGSGIISTSIVIFMEARLEQGASRNTLKREFNLFGIISYILYVFGNIVFFTQYIFENSNEMMSVFLYGYLGSIVSIIYIMCKNLMIAKLIN